MPSWREVNREVVACRGKADAVACLEQLFARIPDGHVAMALGDEHKRAGRIEPARRWYVEAARRYPIETYKARARAAAAQLGSAPLTATRVSSNRLSRPNSSELHVISCSRRKAWDDPSVTDRFLPASKAYKGDEIADWLARPESARARWVVLSAKYGFIEPDHPVDHYDVTFNDTNTGPITDDALKAQVEHQVRWADRVPLRQFGRVVVHGSGEYLKKTRAAFAASGASVLSASAAIADADLQATPVSATVDTSRAAAIGRALAAVPIACYDRLDASEPEWPILQKLARVEHPWGVMAALAFGLCDYQLGAGGATEYWKSIGRLLQDRPLDSRQRLRAFVGQLVLEPVSSRLTDQKVARIARLLASDLPDWCGGRAMAAIGEDAGGLWSRLAAVMGQSSEAKTIAFAMKCFDLLFKASNGRYSDLKGAPIIVDLRIARISLTSGLLSVPDGDLAALLRDATAVANAYREELLQAWRLVQQNAGGLSLFRIDSLLWQVAEIIHDERASRRAAIERTTAALTTAGVDGQVAKMIASELTKALE